VALIHLRPKVTYGFLLTAALTQKFHSGIISLLPQGFTRALYSSRVGLSDVSTSADDKLAAELATNAEKMDAVCSPRPVHALRGAEGGVAPNSFTQGVEVAGQSSRFLPLGVRHAQQGLGFPC
jgi:hypothetical protein